VHVLLGALVFILKYFTAPYKLSYYYYYYYYYYYSDFIDRATAVYNSNICNVVYFCEKVKQREKNQ